MNRVFALAADAVRQILRVRTVLLLVAIGVLLGVFVRLTAVGGAHEEDALPGLVPNEEPGAVAAALLGGLFGLALVHGVIAALFLGAEDRRTGLLVQVAVRPLSRLAYAAGRTLGLAVTACGGLLAMAIPAAIASGVGAELPSLQRLELARTVTVAGESLDRTGAAWLRDGETARFEFDTGAGSAATVKVHPVPGSDWNGLVDLDVRGDGGATQSFEGWRPRRPLRVDLAPADADGPVAVELTLRSAGCALEIDFETVAFEGTPVAYAGEAVAALALAAAAAAVLAALSFFFGTALSPGPAGLAAGFTWLIAQGRPAVLDIVAGLGVVEWMRDALSALFKLFPDLGRFDGAEYLSLLQALPEGIGAAAMETALPAFAAAVLLTAATVRLVER